MAMLRSIVDGYERNKKTVEYRITAALSSLVKVSLRV
jgi:hypothetical protein